MRISRVLVMVGIFLAGIFAFAPPASATTFFQWDASGDEASYDNVTNVLGVCDHTAGNGTAMATLNVNDGGVWTLFDSNGADGSHCKYAGPLSVNDSKSAILYICNNSSCGDIHSVWVNHL